MLRLRDSLREHIEVARAFEVYLPTLKSLADDCIKSLEQGGRIFVCGNGGSAADAQHFAAELTGRFEKERRSLAAIALTTDTSALTAIANDYGYEEVFSRQLEGLSSPGDVFIGISTSGTSKNILTIFEDSRFRDLKKILLTGSTFSHVDTLQIDHTIMVPSQKTTRIQELHIFVLHAICSLIEDAFIDE